MSSFPQFSGVVVTPSRLAALQKQAQSLALHQKKLQEEVQLLENKYTSKRARFLDDADRFRKELKRVMHACLSPSHVVTSRLIHSVPRFTTILRLRGRSQLFSSPQRTSLSDLGQDVT